MKNLFNAPFVTRRIRVAGAIVSVIAAVTSAADTLEEVLVTSQFRTIDVLDLANSVSVFSQQDIAARGANNIDQLLNMAPNVNFSAGASRGRFVQIRGIGERSQFIDPINPSVGLLIDGIDFTGLGLAGNTFDIEQVEILRGPQGTLYGANALAGLIAVTSNRPSATPITTINAELGEYDTRTLGVVNSGPLNDDLSYRLAIQNHRSDGYIDNGYLHRDNTNNIDETIIRGKLRIDASDDLQLDVTAVYIDVDKGYDAFSLANTRQTLSDQPGWDRQESVAASLRAQWSAHRAFNVETVVSIADSDTEYGYDEDWTFVGFHPFEYSSTDNYQRQRDTISADMRLVSAPDQNLFNDNSSWVVGLYLRSEDEDLQRRASFNSHFDTENYAVYGQLRSSLTQRLELVTGLRIERRTADYDDNVGVVSDNDEDLWGGNIALEYHHNSDVMVYGLLSRGYKAGGINARIISAAVTNPAIGSDTFTFAKEHMLNYELGLKGRWLNDRLQMQLALFYQDRNDVQAKQSLFNPNDFSFDDFLANAAGANTSGLELAIDYLATDRVRLFANIGLLDAEFDDFISAAHVDARDDNSGLTLAPVDLDGRALAHAPDYQFFAGSEVALNAHWLLRVEIEGKDAFYFSNSHNERSGSYELFNARLMYQRANWEVAVWGRNLTDKDYATRGFYFSNQFGNNPANGYAPEAYYQYGEPRVIGVSGSFSF